MDTDYLIVGIFVVLLLITALQAYQLNGMSTKMMGLTGATALIKSQPATPVQTTQQGGALPTQVGGC